ncbi:cyclase family protein [Methanolobus mangrovi]|uniref:Cyclase family protein n=1 Tax=Methanolobus mangrovi TaxID=3072977 RepID=A0AA51UDC2_9EURY|nr:cyclase family protein [Methanolobus mangrovi]WMW21090.1 cyclase family protein [Methanolobus mangrovi]
MSGRIIDITTGISPNTPVYEGDPIPLIEKVSSIEKDGFVVSRISIGTHTGTHVDAPSHIFEDGTPVDGLDPESFMGKAVLLDLSLGKGCITSDELGKHYLEYADENDIDVVLIKTGTHFESSDTTDFGRKLAATAGSWIIENGFRVVGVDTLSVDTDPSLPNHNLFLRNGLNIVEYLNFSDAKAGIYYFICLPLKLVGCDGAPARAILLDMAFFT